MSITTYDELKTTLQTFVDDNDIASSVSNIITLAEGMIKSSIRTVKMESIEPLTLSTSSNKLAVPANFLSCKSFILNTSPIWYLELATPDQVNALSYESTGKPYKYAIVGDEFVFDRTPNSAYSANAYCYLFEGLSDSNTSNAVFAQYPDIYLTACMHWAYMLTHEDERADKMLGMFNILAEQIEATDKATRYGGPIRARIRSNIN